METILHGDGTLGTGAEVSTTTTTTAIGCCNEVTGRSFGCKKI
jgi:hypothetical protein